MNKCNCGRKNNKNCINKLCIQCCNNINKKCKAHPIKINMIHKNEEGVEGEEKEDTDNEIDEEYEEDKNIYTNDDLETDDRIKITENTQIKCNCCDEIMRMKVSEICDFCNKIYCDDCMKGTLIITCINNNVANCIGHIKNYCLFCYVQNQEYFDKNNDTDNEEIDDNTDDEEIDYESDESQYNISTIKLRADSPVEVATNDKDMCCICFTNRKTYAFTPCGHLCICGLCKSGPITECPICRKEIKSIIKIYS
jgi:hypothetical protein